MRWDLDREWWMRWGLPGCLCIGFQALLILIAPDFAYERSNFSKPIALLVAIGLLAGMVYLSVVWASHGSRDSGRLLIWLIAVGLILRLAMFLTTPMLEDDFYRYLWDGAVVAHGENPYAHAPSDVTERADSVPEVLHDLAGASGSIIERVNHPSLRTIYPSIAQGAFALAHWARPWSLTAWRLVLLVSEGVTLLLLLGLLRELGLPRTWSVVYWWNPLLVKEIFNSGHMDALIVPFVLGALLLAIRERHLLASVSLACALGVKLWPVLLLPLLLRPLLSRPGKLIASATIFGLLVAAILLPVILTGLDPESGFTAYSQRWEMNDLFFMLILWLSQAAIKLIPLAGPSAQAVTRGVVIALVALWVARLSWRPVQDGRDLLNRATWMVAGMFLLSPTQFPWYYTWLLPFLVFRPQFSLLLLTPLLFLYYLRFHFAARGQVGVFDYGIVWLEYIPVAVLLGWEWYRSRGRIRGVRQSLRYSDDG